MVREADAQIAAIVDLIPEATLGGGEPSVPRWFREKVKTGEIKI